MTTKLGGGAPKCPKCGKSVYHAEQVVGAGKTWHKRCFTCTSCNKSLDSTTVTEHESKIYCKACYGSNYGPHVFGFAGGGAMAHTAPKTTGGGSSSGGGGGGGGGGGFCSSCGAKSGGGRFCSGCGAQV